MIRTAPLLLLTQAWIVEPDAIRIAATRIGDGHGESLEEDDVDDRVPRRHERHVAESL